MLNQLLKFTLVSSALLWLRPRWRGLLALSVFVVLVHILHSEYLGYVKLSGNDSYLVHSYVVKWLALIGALVTYYLLAVAGLKRTPVIHEKRQQIVDDRPGTALEKDDGFDFLRDKSKLQSRAEKLLREERGDRDTNRKP